MALTFVVEDGSAPAGANSYCTTAFADNYHYSRLGSEDWQNAATTTKEAALVWATRLLDEQVTWVGTKKAKDNPLRWPRYGAVDREGWWIDTTTIPTELKNATAELARVLIVEGDRTAEEDTLGFKSLRVGEVSLEIDKQDRKNIIPPGVISIIGPLGTVQSNRSQYVRLSRS